MADSCTTSAQIDWLETGRRAISPSPKALMPRQYGRVGSSSGCHRPIGDGYAPTGSSPANGVSPV